MFIKQELDKVLQDLESCQSDLERELRSLPEGEFYQQTVNGKRYYYERFPIKGRRKKVHRNGITGDPEKVMRLVRKEYVASSLDIVNENIEVVRRAAAKYRPFDENTVMRNFAEKHPDLVDGIYWGKTDYGKWAEAHTPRTDLYSSERRSLTDEGVQMRSRGELYISSRLEHHNIPFRYEAPIPHPDISFIPDFTIRRPRDGKIFYWEHFGLVNDEQYMMNACHKLDVYERYGIVPWDNLIITYDQKDGGINGQIIEAMIKGWLL